MTATARRAFGRARIGPTRSCAGWAIARERYLAEKSYALTMAGRWDEALAAAARIGDVRFSAVVSVLSGPCELLVHRGELEEARIILELVSRSGTRPTCRTSRASAAARAMLAYADGRPNEALEAGDEAISVGRVFGSASRR